MIIKRYFNSIFEWVELYKYSIRQTRTRAVTSVGSKSFKHLLSEIFWQYFGWTKATGGTKKGTFVATQCGFHGKPSFLVDAFYVFSSAWAIVTKKYTYLGFLILSFLLGSPIVYLFARNATFLLIFLTCTFCSVPYLRQFKRNERYLFQTHVMMYKSCVYI